MNIAILGLGLIGGSIGLAAREGDGASTMRVVGFDPDEQTSLAAVAAGAIEQAAATAPQALADADVAFIAAPVGALAQGVRLALRHAPRGCVVTDVGSTKRALLAELAGEPGIERFIGGHPLAGSEQGGIAHARADMFDGAAWCLMPSGDPEARRRLARLIESFGAHTVKIDAEAHDRLLARISHLPHVFANVLVTGLADCSARERELAAAGPSFRDATRVAGASTAIWADIYLSNADMLAIAIDETIVKLREIREILEAKDGDALRAWNEQAHTARQSVLP